MSAIALSCIALACISGGALLGMYLRRTLPGHHLNADEGRGPAGHGPHRDHSSTCSRPADRLGEEFVRHAEHSSQTDEANIVLLDRFLEQYGPETGAVRNLLRRGVTVLADRMWRENSSDLAEAAPFEASAASETFYAKIEELSPQNDAQRSLQARAIQISTDIAQTRLQLFAQMRNSIPMPFLVVLIFWLTIIFASFSLFAQPNAIVIGSLLIFALSAAGAIYLVLELGQPFEGLMQISSAPLRNALTPLGS